MPPAEAVFSSPKKRCQETAALFFPGQCRIIVPDLRNVILEFLRIKTGENCRGNPAYQKWIDSGDTLPFPGGESGRDFKEVPGGFSGSIGILQKGRDRKSCHCDPRGTIRSILSAWGEPARGFYDWNPKNGGGYRIRVKEGEPLSLEILEEIT